MSYLKKNQLFKYGFKKLGNNVKISSKAAIYNPEFIELDDNCRIDDFCIISGSVKIGKYVHITPMCLLAGGIPGIEIDDFSTLAYGVKIFSQSDDYSGETMCNSLIPKEFKQEVFKKILIGRQVIIGTNSVIMPGAFVPDGCAIGAMSLVLRPIEPWGIYIGAPVKRIKDRNKNLLNLESKFLTNLQ
jgi:acetyltransferase-like isoleucine patch superfamily enzyme